MKATKVFYDGHCKVCSTEKEHYSHLTAIKPVEWVDIHSKSFEAYKKEIPFDQAMKKIHLQKPSGEIVQGVDVFIEIWKLYPGYRTLGTLVGLPGIHALGKLGYAIFARNRYFFSRFLKRDKQCNDDSCSL